MCDASEAESAPASAAPAGAAARGAARQRARLCDKCKVERPVISSRQSVWCKACALDVIRIRHSSAISKNQLISPGDRVLLAFSGGACSRALLHLNALHLEAIQPYSALPYELHVAFVDTTPLTCPQTAEAHAALRASMEAVVRGASDTLGLRLDWLELEPAARALWASCTTDSAREALLWLLRDRALTAHAQATGAAKVLLADSVTRIGVRTLALTTEGRGAAVPLLAGWKDVRQGGVEFVRPLRDTNARDLAWFCHVQRLETLVVPGLRLRAPAAGGMERLTADFVYKLESGFTGTTSTIMRTGAKLSVGGSSALCSVCGLAVCPDPGQSRCYGCVVLLRDVAVLPYWIADVRQVEEAGSIGGGVGGGGVGGGDAGGGVLVYVTACVCVRKPASEEREANDRGAFVSVSLPAPCLLVCALLLVLAVLPHARL